MVVNKGNKAFHLYRLKTCGRKKSKANWHREEIEIIWPDGISSLATIGNLASKSSPFLLGPLLLGFRNRMPVPPPFSSMNSRVKTSLITVSEWDLLRTDQLMMVFR